MKKISAYEIALSAVSCAIAAIALTVGTLYTPLLFTGYLFAGFALMIPLAKNCWWGDVLAFIGASLIALMFNGFNFFDTLPFIMFFGLHPLVNALQLKFKVKRWIAMPVKAVWFDASMYFVWRVVTGMAAPFGWVGESVYHSHSPHRRYGIFLSLRLYDFQVSGFRQSDYRADHQKMTDGAWAP